MYLSIIVVDNFIFYSSTVKILRTISSRLNNTYWNIGQTPTPCTGFNRTISEERHSNVSCNCTFNDGNVCHVVSMYVWFSLIVLPKSSIFVYIDAISIVEQIWKLSCFPYQLAYVHATVPNGTWVFERITDKMLSKEIVAVIFCKCLLDFTKLLIFLQKHLLY